MRATDLIRQKRQGGALSSQQIRWFVDGVTHDTLPDYQVAALLMAIFFNGMTPEELATLTEAMLRSGTVLDLSHLPGYKVDKHSTGGVGDKISLPLAPVVAACGVPVPMVSGRGLGHTGGTLDKLESITGFRTDLSLDRFTELVDTLGLGLIGQTGEIAPADKRLYALRDVTATVESIPLIASSIMSKKMAEGIDGLVLDVKVGRGAFMPTVEQARTLANTMIELGHHLGRDVVALLTNMDTPLGLAVGNALEVVESVEVLRGGGPADIRALTLRLAEEMLALAGKDPAEAERALDDGRALACFREVVEAQGGDVALIDDLDKLPKAKHVEPLLATESGYVTALHARAVGEAAMRLGAGRATKEEGVNPAVGLMLVAKPGDEVKAGEPLAWIHHDEVGLEAAHARLDGAWSIGEAPPEEAPLVYERLAWPIPGAE